MAQSYHAAGGASTRSYTFSQKWGDDPFTALGYAQIPLALFRYGARLGIAPDEGYLICHLWQFKWSPSDEGPSEALLAERFGKSDDTVRRLLHRLEKKGFLKIERQRGELGYYTHTTYDFRPLRDWLNECYWQDHPQERPKGKKARRLPFQAKATPQIRGVVKQQRKTPPDLPAEQSPASPQNGGEPPRRFAGTLIDIPEKEDSEKEAILPAALSEGKDGQDTGPIPREPSRQKDASGWEKLTAAERLVWEERARQMFVLNGVAAPGARAVGRQASVLWGRAQGGDGVRDIVTC